ncbi:MAG: GNAT family N-acetyltransferase [Lachnospiraceae bacterium]|nr:GNAT family N-acetyltransferase [Lachnospiraceae bacterium]
MERSNVLESKLFGENHTADKNLLEKFEFRDIKPEEAEQAVAIEQICFPPNEACSEQHMRERMRKAPDLFLAAMDKETGRIAGFLNGIATNEDSFRDEFFTDAELHDPNGKNIMLVGLDVLPEYRRQGLGRELVFQYLRREREKGRKMLVLTCLESKVEMYQKFGFTDNGIANSTWGGEEWHEMSHAI